MAQVAVVQGGPSAEAEVSRTSAAAVTQALLESGHEVERLEVDQYLPAALAKGPFDVVFPVVHGRHGEDGTLQGLCELIGLPYVGSGVLASALAFDKVRAKQLFRQVDLVVPEERVVRRGEDLEQAAAVVRRTIGDAVVVKPAAQGSAIGVTRVTPDDPVAVLVEALRSGFVYDERMLCERWVQGREVTCAVLDVPSLGATRAMAPTEIFANLADYYDFKSRYASGGSDHCCPADLPEPLTARVQRMAVAAHQVLGCRDLSRADFVVPAGDDPAAVVLLEVNTMPGMTGTSLYPEAVNQGGIRFAQLCAGMVKAALERPGLQEVPVLAMP